jgi:hypothetical protein
MMPTHGSTSLRVLATILQPPCHVHGVHLTYASAWHLHLLSKTMSLLCFSCLHKHHTQIRMHQLFVLLIINHQCSPQLTHPLPFLSPTFTPHPQA